MSSGSHPHLALEVGDHSRRWQEPSCLAGTGKCAVVQGVLLRTFRKGEVEPLWMGTLLLWSQWEIAET